MSESGYHDCIYFLSSCVCLFVVVVVGANAWRVCFCLYFSFFFLFFYVRVRLCILGLFFSSCGAHDTGCVKCTPYVHQLLVRVLAYVSAPAVAECVFFLRNEIQMQKEMEQDLAIFVCLFVIRLGWDFVFIYLCKGEVLCFFFLLFQIRLLSR